jgi:hypothetical protein
MSERPRVFLLIVLAIGSLCLRPDWVLAAGERDRSANRERRERYDRLRSESKRESQAPAANRALNPPARPTGPPPGVRPERPSRRPPVQSPGSNAARSSFDGRNRRSHGAMTAPTTTGLAPTPNQTTPRSLGARAQNRADRERGQRRWRNDNRPRPTPPPAAPNPPAAKPSPPSQAWRDPAKPNPVPPHYGSRPPRPIPHNWRRSPHWPNSPFWRGTRKPWYSSLFWLYNLRSLPSSRAVFTRVDGGMWVAAAHNLSLGLFWEYKRAR